LVLASAVASVEVLVEASVEVLVEESVEVLVDVSAAVSAWVLVHTLALR
jgi:hypothetical protein